MNRKLNYRKWNCRHVVILRTFNQPITSMYIFIDWIKYVLQLIVLKYRRQIKFKMCISLPLLLSCLVSSVFAYVFFPLYLFCNVWNSLLNNKTVAVHLYAFTPANFRIHFFTRIGHKISRNEKFVQQNSNDAWTTYHNAKWR